MPDVWDQNQEVREEEHVPRSAPAARVNLTAECAKPNMRQVADMIHRLLCRGDHKTDAQENRCDYFLETWERAQATEADRRRSYKAAEKLDEVAKKHWLTAKKLLVIFDQVANISLEDE